MQALEVSSSEMMFQGCCSDEFNPEEKTAPLPVLLLLRMPYRHHCLMDSSCLTFSLRNSFGANVAVAITLASIPLFFHD